jgi:hypothetical protein
MGEQGRATGCLAHRARKIITWDELHVGSRNAFAAAGVQRSDKVHHATRGDADRASCRARGVPAHSSARRVQPDRECFQAADEGAGSVAEFGCRYREGHVRESVEQAAEGDFCFQPG